MIRRRVLVRGKVQGVWFRDSMREQAERHEVSGWVRNLPDGSVEAVLEGDDDAVAALVDWAHDGPPRAVVVSVEVGVLDHEPPGDDGEAAVGFEIR